MAHEGNFPVGYTGTQYILALKAVDDQTGEGINLTNYTVKAGLHDLQARSQVIHVESGDGILLADPVSGIFEIQFIPGQTGGLCPKQYELRCTVQPNDNPNAVEELTVGQILFRNGKTAG